jgi:MFS superfamily sulfate permease-like transporter
VKVVPDWLSGYRREWLTPHLVAGAIVWSVVAPQCVAYAQIAGLPPEAGLMAAPGALVAYAFLGTSRTLVVSATTATSAMSASAVGPLANGDAATFAALSAALPSSPPWYWRRAGCWGSAPSRTSSQRR